MAKATALALTLVMLAAMLPAQVFAADAPEYQNLWPGQMVTASSNVAASTSAGWSYLDNGFIRFGVTLNNTKHGVNMVTLPSILKNQETAFYSNSVYQTADWFFTAWSNGTLKTRPAIASSAAVQLNSDNIRVAYTFTGSDRSGAFYSFTETLIFSLVKLDDSDGHTNNYGVQAQRVSSGDIPDVGLGEDPSFGWTMNFVGFHKMGHLSAGKDDVAVQTLNRDHDGNATYTTITKGLGYTTTNGSPAITQVVNNSFNWANLLYFCPTCMGRIIILVSPKTPTSTPTQLSITSQPQTRLYSRPTITVETTAMAYGDSATWLIPA